MAGRSPLSGAKRTYRRRRSKTGFELNSTFCERQFLQCERLIRSQKRASLG